MASAFARSPDGKLLASGDSDRRVRTWDAMTGKELASFQGHQAPVLALSFSPDHKSLASGDEGGSIRLWETATGKELHQLLGHRGSVECLSCSPDGRLLASGGIDATVRLWDLVTGKELSQWPAHQSAVVGITFSADGKSLATAGRDEGIRLWEVATGKPRAEFAPAKQGAVGLFGSVGFSGNGRLLAGTTDRTRVIRVWDLVTRQEVKQFQGHEGWVRSLTFAADGRTLASASEDTTILLWDVSGLPPGRNAPDVDLTDEALKGWWEELAGDDAARAFGAIGALAVAPRRAVPWLQKNLPPAAVVEGLRIDRLIADLESDAFEEREKASRELEAAGELAEEALRKAVADSSSPEVRKRAEVLLVKLQPGGSPQRLRALRAVETLERIGTAESKEVLAALAKGAPGARLTREAATALARLTKERGKE
jgi:hypothetical protein